MSVNESRIDQLHMPGEIILDLNVENSDPDTIQDAVDGLVLGPGLRLTEDDRVSVCQPGRLRHRPPNCYWVDTVARRYVPARGEYVLGVVLRKTVEFFRVDIGSAEPATLSYLSFENATKRNRPDVQIGDVVYGRLMVAEADVEPELACVDGNGRASGMGVQPRDSGGLLFQCSSQLVRKLLERRSAAGGNHVLAQLGKFLPHEVTVGHNGRIWVCGRSPRETVTVANALLACESLTEDEIRDMVKKLTRSSASFRTV